MSRNHSRLLIRVALLVLIVGWVVGLGCYPLVYWSPLNCIHNDIDLNTGRIRHQRYLLGICVQEYVEHSPISHELGRGLGFVGVASDWKRVNTFSPLVHHSPHYRFHACIHQAQELKLIWESARFTPLARRFSAQHVLSLWEEEQSTEEVDEFLNALSALESKHKANLSPITPENIISHMQPADNADKALE